MSVVAVVLSIIGGGGIIGLLGTLVKISMDYQKQKGNCESISTEVSTMKQTIKNNEVKMSAMEVEITQLKTRLAHNEKLDEDEKKIMKTNLNSYLIPEIKPMKP